jgi:signal transduction histidine kinase
VTESKSAVAEGLSRLSNALRTPLALINGYAELLTINPDQALAEAPGQIKAAAADLGRIVDDLLTVYAIDTETIYLTPAPTAVGMLVEEAIVEARNRGTNVSVEADERSRETEIMADPDYTRSMIATLLENARNRAANSGATLEAQRLSGFVHIEVGDLGGAMNVDERANAFEAFSSVQPRTGLTSGLELYKVRRLAELQHGHVWAAEGPGTETRFGFALPVARSS